MLESGYGQVVRLLPAVLSKPLFSVEKSVQDRVTEIRLRAGCPVTVMEHSQPRFLRMDGSFSNLPESGCVEMDKALLEKAFLSLCGWAVHTRQRELNLGYIGLPGGHRAGIGATAIVQEGVVTGQRDIHSINLRIAHQVFGAANEVLERCVEQGGILVAGAPASGKTTVLRDMARQLGGRSGGFLKVAVVDETGELSGVTPEGAQNDLGVTTDLLLGCPKSWGLEAALRYLSPQVLICDEIASDKEIDGVIAAANGGVAVVTSLHCANRQELCRKESFRRLRQAGVFRYVVFLRGGDTPCTVWDVWDLQEMGKDVDKCC